MADRKNPRLAYCEYVAQGNGSIAVEQARWDLMRCIRRVFPEMLERLSTDVFPAYAALAKSDLDIEDAKRGQAALFSLSAALAKSDLDIEAILWHPRLSPFKELPQDSPLRTALSRWAREFHAEQDWFLDEMLRTLRGWHVMPLWRSELECNPIGKVISIVAWGEPFRLDCEGWKMQTYTWANYSRSVRKRFEQRLAEYEQASRKLAESRGLVRGPHKYSSENLDWFVLYQFAGLSSKKIADRERAKWSGEAASRYGDAASGILKGVKAAARLIRWDS